jgi:Trp operon repressor
MQRAEHVAGIRLAQQALANTQMQCVINGRLTESERNELRQRRVAIRHVIDTGTVYEPLVEKWRGAEE